MSIKTYNVDQLQKLNNVITETLGLVIMGEENYLKYLKKTMVWVQPYKIDNHFNAIQKHAKEITAKLRDGADKFDIKF